MSFHGRGILISYEGLTGIFCSQIVSQDRLAFGMTYEKIPHGKVCNIDVSQWYPRKSTGPESQNNHAFGHARQIGQHIGEDVEEVLRGACIRAEKRGFPIHRNAFGEAIPLRWSEVDSAQASYVIDQLHEDGSFLGLQLIESDWGAEK